MEGRGQPTRAASAITHTRRHEELRVLSRPLSSLARTYSINLVERSKVLFVKVLLPRGYVSCTVVELGHCVSYDRYCCFGLNIIISLFP